MEIRLVSKKDGELGLSVFTIFPAIDLRHGTVVRLEQGDPDRLTRFSTDPAASARRWFEDGAAWLHVVNLDGAFGEADVRNRNAILTILDTARQQGTRVQLGGGIRSFQDVQAALDLGVDRLVLGTLSVEQPDVLARAIDAYGPDRVAAAVDARDGSVKVHGWQKATQKSVLDLANELWALGLMWLIFTDIARDGVGTGLNVDITRQLTNLHGLKVIASGGVHDEGDIVKAREAGCAGVIVGRSLYDGRLTIRQWEYR